jgi:hypothetical protein
MKTGINLVVALCSVLILGALGAELPATNQVARYERSASEGKWREVTRSDGEIVLACLRDMDSFKTWGSTVPPGIIADPIPTGIGFRIVGSSGKTNVVIFSWNAELVDCSRGLLVVPKKEEKLLAELLAKWREADNARIASQPLPCKYSIGTANDGGTLSGVARLFYGDSTQWRRIYEANKTVIKNPNVIQLGTVITIPRLPEASNNKRSAANGSRTFRSDTNTTSAAAGSRR